MDLQTFVIYSKRVIDDPKRLLKILISPGARGMILNSWKEPNSYNFLNFITHISESSYQKYLQEIRNDKKFYTHLHKKHKEIRGKTITQAQGWTTLIYVLIRYLKPKVILETGVFDGISSSFVLNALKKNGFGKLISVDLPARVVIPGSTDFMPFTTIPKDQQPGWLIPSDLRKRWTLHIIKEGHELKKIIQSLDNIDIFLHDSLHTKEHMEWEMQTVWPHLKKDGILLVDDIFCNNAFEIFCKKMNKNNIFKYGLGALRK